MHAYGHHVPPSRVRRWSGFVAGASRVTEEPADKTLVSESRRGIAGSDKLILAANIDRKSVV